jgi:hypothetical protein
MTYFADLTPYTYLADEDRTAGAVLNVGWLDDGHPFPTGQCPDGVVAVLNRLVRAPVQLTRGYHYCELCQQALGPQADRAALDGVVRGNGEIRVRGRGVGYAAPVLLVHYVMAHDYLPPAEFLRAVQPRS